MLHYKLSKREGAFVYDVVDRLKYKDVAFIRVYSTVHKIHNIRFITYYLGQVGI